MENLRIAIQKSGRLYLGAIKLLKKCGIDMKLGKKFQIFAKNFPLEIFLVRDDDIPKYIEYGYADLGIVGKNVVFEQKKDLFIKENLGFGHCRLSLAVPKNFKYFDIKNLSETKIATSYPVILKNFLKKKNINAEIIFLSGSVEIAPNIGLSDAICDIVSSGETLFMNNLQEVEVIFESEAVLIANTKMSSKRRELAEKLFLKINEVKKALSKKYLILKTKKNFFQEALKCLTCTKNTTILPIRNSNFRLVHTVVDNICKCIEKLKTITTQDILVVPIKKMIE